MEGGFLTFLTLLHRKHQRLWLYIYVIYEDEIKRLLELETRIEDEIPH